MSVFQATSTALIHLAVDSFASAPHFTDAQKRTRTEAVVGAIMAFLPTEPVQVLLASQAVGHHLTLLDTFRDITNRALSDPIAVRMRLASAAQTRLTLALVKELRVQRREALAAAEAERAAMPAPQPEPPPPPEPDPAPDQDQAAAPDADDATRAAHMAAFQEALAAANATLAEAAVWEASADRVNGHQGKAAPASGIAARGGVRSASPGP